MSPSALPKLKSRLDKLSADVKTQLIEQGFSEERIKFERMLNMRFDGTDTVIMVLEKEGQGESSFEGEFKKQYKAEFGFLLEEKNIIIDDAKVSTRSASFDTYLSIYGAIEYSICVELLGSRYWQNIRYIGCIGLR